MTISFPCKSASSQFISILEPATVASPLPPYVTSWKLFLFSSSLILASFVPRSMQISGLPIKASLTRLTQGEPILKRFCAYKLNTYDNSRDMCDIVINGQDHLMEQGSLFTVGSGAEEKTIQMVDVGGLAESCGFRVDGITMWIDVDETQNINGLNITVNSGFWRNTRDNGQDTCSADINGQVYNFIEGETAFIGDHQVHLIDVSMDTGASTCTERWECTSWSTCSNNERTRTCTDANNCGTLDYLPTEIQSCSSSGGGSGGGGGGIAVPIPLSEGCQLNVDGMISTIYVGESETINGVNIAVLDMKAIYTQQRDVDICKLVIAANEIKLRDTFEIEFNGAEIDGSDVLFHNRPGEWLGLEIDFDPEDDIYLEQGDEFVDPILGGFKFMFVDQHFDEEKIIFETSGNKGRLAFLNFDEQMVEIPFFGDVDVMLGTGTDVDDRLYLEGDVCNGIDVTDCIGAQFFVVHNNIARVIELSSIDDPAGSNPEIDFQDLTYGINSNGNGYTQGLNNFDLPRGAGTITLEIDTATGAITFIKTEDSEIYTSHKAVLTFHGGWLNFMNPTTQESLAFRFLMTEDILTVGGPGTNEFFGPIDYSDTNDDTIVYFAHYGTLLEKDGNDLLILHPKERLSIDYYIGTPDAYMITGEGNCTSIRIFNPIPSTVNKFDTEISDPYAQNLLSIGSPCVNRVSEALMGNPEICMDLGTNEARIKLLENRNNFQLVTYGGSGDATVAGSRMLMNWDEADLHGNDMVITT